MSNEKTKCLWKFSNTIHEDISYSMLEQNAKVVVTDIIIHHLGNMDAKRFKLKNRRNYKLLAREISSGQAHVLTYFHMVNCLMIEEDFKRAIEYIDYALVNFKLKPEDPIVPKFRILRGLCGLKLYDLGKDTRWREAAQADFMVSYGLKESSEAAVNLAEIYMQEEKWDETIALLEKHYTGFEQEKIIGIPFDYKNIYLLIIFKLGECYLKKENWPKAEEYFKKFAELNPNNLEGIDKLCAVLRQAGKWNEANFLTAKAVNVWPGYVSGWANLGAFELQQKRFVTAELFLRRALSLKPDYQEAIYNLGIIREVKRNKLGQCR